MPRQAIGPRKSVRGFGTALSTVGCRARLRSVGLVLGTRPIEAHMATAIGAVNRRKWGHKLEVGFGADHATNVLLPVTLLWQIATLALFGQLPRRCGYDWHPWVATIGACEGPKVAT